MWVHLYAKDRKYGRQFIIVLFATIINKSQGDYRKCCTQRLCLHILLYGMSRIILRAELKILVTNKDDDDTNVTLNVVFKEVFYNL